MNISEDNTNKHNQLYKKASKLISKYIITDENHNPHGFFVKRKLRKAVQILQEALTLNSQNSSAYFLLGKAYQSLKQLDNALPIIIKAHELEPTNPLFIREIGFTAGSLNNHELAIKYMEPFITSNPNDGGILFNLGLSYLFTEKPDKALDYFEASLKIEANNTITTKIIKMCKKVIAGKINCPKNEKEIGRLL